jgi:hypothetical protein
MWGAVLVLLCRWVAECVGNGPPTRAAILFPLAALSAADSRSDPHPIRRPLRSRSVPCFRSY